VAVDLPAGATEFTVEASSDTPRAVTLIDSKATGKRTIAYAHPIRRVEVSFTVDGVVARTVFLYVRAGRAFRQVASLSTGDIVYGVALSGDGQVLAAGNGSSGVLPDPSPERGLVVFTASDGGWSAPTPLGQPGQPGWTVGLSSSGDVLASSHQTGPWWWPATARKCGRLGVTRRALRHCLEPTEADGRRALLFPPAPWRSRPATTAAGWP
jgi:hypothetical protein